MDALSSEFERLGTAMMKCRQCRSETTRIRRFVGFFGIEPVHCAIVWRELDSFGWTRLTRNAELKHLLWALHFLRRYKTEEVLSALAGPVDEKTARKWVWFYVEGITRLLPKFVRYTLLSI
jgi:hypothetical protein